MTTSEIQHRADFSEIRYAQCWEDSRLLTASLLPAGRHCLSIGSAGENSFALLAAGAASVTAVEMNPAQIACIELRKAANLHLDHPALLELIGSRPSDRRAALYQKVRSELPETVRAFWDARPEAVAGGIGSAGKFERYFATFRHRVLPLAHSRKRVLSLLEPREPEARLRFYETVWNNRRWRWIFQIFFSRAVMGALGRFSNTSKARWRSGSFRARATRWPCWIHPQTPTFIGSSPARMAMRCLKRWRKRIFNRSALPWRTDVSGSHHLRLKRCCNPSRSADMTRSISRTFSST